MSHKTANQNYFIKDYVIIFLIDNLFYTKGPKMLFKYSVGENSKLVDETIKKLGEENVV